MSYSFTRNGWCVEWSIDPNHTTWWCIIKNVVTWQDGFCGWITTPVLQNTNTMYAQIAAPDLVYTSLTWIWRTRYSDRSTCGPWLTAWPQRGSSSGSAIYMVSAVCGAHRLSEGVIHYYSYVSLSPSCQWPCQSCNPGSATFWLHQKEYQQSYLCCPVHFKLISVLSLNWANAVRSHLPGEWDNSFCIRKMLEN